MAQETEERLVVNVRVTIMSIESDILREIDFAAIINQRHCCGQLEWFWLYQLEEPQTRLP